MKRLLILIVLVIMAAAWVTTFRVSRSRRVHHGTFHRSSPAVHVHVAHPGGEYFEYDDEDDDQDDDGLEQSVAEAHNEARRAVAQAKVEVRQALKEAARDVRRAMNEAAQDIRESVQDIPVPILPGTRVTNAEPQPPAPPQPPRRQVRVKVKPVPPQPPAPPRPPVVAKPVPTRTISGQLSATEERARADARRQFVEEIAVWLEPEVDRSWKPAERQIDSMILETKVIPVVKPYGTLHVAELKVDTSPERRAQLVKTYERQVVQKRLVTLGGALGFVLICLGVVSGYIRADEATKGYYTNRLRLLAAGGVGAAGVIIYQMLT